MAIRARSRRSRTGRSPLFEERLVVVKELVVRERVVVRKRTVTEHERIEAELRTERIEIEGNLENDPSE